MTDGLCDRLSVGQRYFTEALTQTKPGSVVVGKLRPVFKASASTQGLCQDGTRQSSCKIWKFLYSHLTDEAQKGKYKVIFLSTEMF